MSQIVERDVDPSLIIDLGTNARFGLRKQRIESLAEEIKQAGRVLHRVGLYPTGDGKFGIKYGNYRVAAIEHLNSEGAMLKVPATIYPAPDGEEGKKDVLLTNLMENLARQDLTLMDQAVAIKQLQDAGVDKLKIRTMFKRPGKKEPAANSWINIVLGFLDLPKKVQTKIHEGYFTWDGAKELVTVNRTRPDRLEDVLIELEEERQKEIAREEKEEERFKASVKKAEEAKSKMEQAVLDSAQKEKEYQEGLEAARAKVNALKAEAAELLAKYDDELAAAFPKVKQAQDLESTKAANKEVSRITKDREAVRAEKEKEILKAQRALDSILDKERKEAEAAKKKLDEAKAEEKAMAAEAKKAATEAKPKGGTAPKKAAEKQVSGATVKKAAGKVGASTELVPLTRKQIMDVVDYLCLPGGAGKSEKAIQSIGEALRSCFNGGLTDKQTYGVILKAVNCK